MIKISSTEVSLRAIAEGPESTPQKAMDKASKIHNSAIYSFGQRMIVAPRDIDNPLPPKGTLV